MRFSTFSGENGSQIDGIFPKYKTMFQFYLKRSLSQQSPEVFGYLRWKNWILGTLTFKGLLRDIIDLEALTVSPDISPLRGKLGQRLPLGVSFSFKRKWNQGGAFVLKRRQDNLLMTGGWSFFYGEELKGGIVLLYSQSLKNIEEKEDKVWFPRIKIDYRLREALHTTFFIDWKNILYWKGFLSFSEGRPIGLRHSFGIHLKGSSFSFSGHSSFSNSLYFSANRTYPDYLNNHKLQIWLKFPPFFKSNVSLKARFERNSMRLEESAEKEFSEKINLWFFVAPLRIKFSFLARQYIENRKTFLRWNGGGEFLWTTEQGMKNKGKLLFSWKEGKESYSFSGESTVLILLNEREKKNRVKNNWEIGIEGGLKKNHSFFFNLGFFLKLKTKNTLINFQGGFKKKNFSPKSFLPLKD